MLNASVGVQRVMGRLRRPQEARRPSARTLQIRSLAAARHMQRGIHTVVVASRLVPVRETTLVAERPPTDSRRPLLWRLGHDRAVAAAVAGILVVGSVVSISGGHTAAATGNTIGAGSEPRLAVGGVDGGGDGTDPGDDTGLVGAVEFGSPDPTLSADDDFAAVDLGDGARQEQPVDVEGPFIDDGTLVKPGAVDTTVPDGRGLVREYKVATGDTLPGIASKFGVSMMSVWWANDLKSKEVKAGRTLRIPPVTGLIVTVAPTDTLDALAAKYDVNSEDILATNGLDDPNLVVGQVLVVPGAKGKAIPKPTSKPAPRQNNSNTASRPSGGGGGSSSNVRPPSSYTGGAFTWPVVGGGNYVSQYFHYGHYAIDIAADYGSTVRAAAAGTVTFAGWKSNGGGYQVWIAHGSGLYTTYNHMSSISVGRGEHVGRGEQVGRVGQSGNATGPHLHFEVWRGPVWDGGRRVNPLGYF
ncbi:MAG: peptidoglycan DD-metalloendopeptidase family protein [Chloroflexota bacterium]